MIFAYENVVLFMHPTQSFKHGQFYGSNNVNNTHKLNIRQRRF